jgi:hypothetical protein
VDLLLCLQFLPINTRRLIKHSQLYLVSIHRTRMHTYVSSTMSSWQNINSDSRLAQLNAGLLCSHGTGFAFSNIPHRFRMWRCSPQAAMVMKMKRMSSLAISVAESAAKLDATACHSFVRGVATFALMKLMRAPISDTKFKRPSRNCFGSRAFVFNLNHIDLHTQSCQFLYTFFSW